MRIIIIGAGLAGQLVLRELRAKGSQAEVLLFSEHHAHFYLKPSLSAVKTQNKSPQDLVMMDQEQVAEAFNCQVFPYTAITGIDKDAKEISTKDAKFSYDYLVLATGAKPIEPAWLKASGNVMRVNHLEEYEAFYDRITKDSEIAIIGGGLIGVEFAHDIAPHCKKVTLIEKANSLMEMMLPKELGNALQIALEQRGVVVQCGQSVERLVDSGQQVTIHMGESVVVDCVLGAIGIRPNIDLAKQSGLEVNMGIKANIHGQTSDPSIYALGDCAEVMGIVKCYVAPLKVCASVIAGNLMGDEQAIQYEPMPVMLKTPTYPVCFCYEYMPKNWDVTVTNEGIQALAYEGDNLIGFALSGEFMKSRMAYKSKMANWLPKTE